jgi:hypothetical protein
MKPIVPPIGVLLLAPAMACGSANSTLTPQTADTASAIAAAEAVGAQQHPKASLHLKLARDQLQEAKELLREDEKERAQLTLQRAKADAELALLLVRESEAKASAQRAQQQVENLPRET